MSNVPAAVLWDMDGTLVDTEPYWFAAENQLVESFGNTWSEEHAHAVVGFDLLDTAAYIIEHGGVDLAPRDVVEHLLDAVITSCRQRLPWRPGARNFSTNFTPSVFLVRLSPCRGDASPKLSSNSFLNHRLR